MDPIAYFPTKKTQVNRNRMVMMHATNPHQRGIFQRFTIRLSTGETIAQRKTEKTNGIMKLRVKYIANEKAMPLIKQHKELLETEGCEVEFTDDAIEEIATMAFLMNEQTENIGARRLHTIMEHLVEDISFELPDVEEKHIVIDAAYVRGKFEDTIRKDDIDRFIL